MCCFNASIKRLLKSVFLYSIPAGSSCEKTPNRVCGTLSALCSVECVSFLSGSDQGWMAMQMLLQNIF